MWSTRLQDAQRSEKLIAPQLLREGWTWALRLVTPRGFRSQRHHKSPAFLSGLADIAKS